MQKINTLITTPRIRNLIIIAIMAIAGAWYHTAQLHVAKPTTKEPQLREVRVANVSDMTNGDMSLSHVGTIVSRAQADVHAESSGRITAVYHDLGDSVSSGTIVATIENSWQNAALMQAQAALSAAKASQSKIMEGTREEQLHILQASSANATSTAINAIMSAYSAVDTAIRGTNSFFANLTSANPIYIPVNYDYASENATNASRAKMVNIVKRQGSASYEVSTNENLVGELETAIAELRTAKEFFDNTIYVLDSSVPSDDFTQDNLDTYMTSTTASRTVMVTHLASLNSALQSIKTATQNEQLGVKGAQTQDIDSAVAQVKLAEAGVYAAKVNLEKTIIRSPISGKINLFSLHKGDNISTGSFVLSITNDDQLEVITHISQNEVGLINIGDKVSIDDTTGTISRIAPSINPSTKSVEVRISIPSDSQLQNGQSVTVTFRRNTKASKTKKQVSKIIIPISSIKMLSNSMYVFTLSASSTLIAHEIKIGSLLGESVAVSEGVTPEMNIVVDARGLSNGQKVLAK